MNVLPAWEATFCWVAQLVFEFGCPAGHLARAAERFRLAMFGVRLDVSWEPGRPVLFPKWLFYVDGSTPFGEGQRFACTRAPVLRAAGPFISQGRKIDACFTRTGGYFFLPVDSRWGRAIQLGSARGGVQGHPGRDQSTEIIVLRRRGHRFRRERAFRVHQSSGSMAI